MALFIVACLMSVNGFAQKDIEKWKLQVSLGVNNPLEDGSQTGYFSKYVNFPSINLGVQHMFRRDWGAKLDFGFNRSSQAAESLPFKLNYTRLNAQVVYDFNTLLPFLPDPVGVVGHLGPGISMTKPLGDFSSNTYSYLNVLSGLEVHYRVSERLSVFVDGSYIYGLSNKNKYDLATDGFSFNGDLMYVAFGLSLSLSDCNYCY